MGKKVLILLLFVLLLPLPLLSKDKLDKNPRKDLVLKGNTSFARADLFKACGVECSKKQIKKNKVKVTEEECFEFVENLSGFYKREGFFDVYIEKNQNEKEFQIVIDEGKGYLIDSIEFSTSTNSLDAERILKDTKLKVLTKEGTRFRVEDYEATKSLLENCFGDEGYPFVRVLEKAEVNLKNKNVKISYSIDEGEKAVFGKTVLEGIIHTEERILRKLLQYQEGEIFQISKIEKTKETLYSTGLFDAVTIKVKKGNEPNTVLIKIILKEGRHRKIKTSIGYGADEKFRFQAGLETLRLFNRYVTAGFNLKKSSLEESYEFHLVRPYAISDWTGYLRARKQTLYWVQTDFETTLLTAGTEKKFSNLSTSFDINYEQINRIKFSYPSPPIKDNALTPQTFFIRLNFSFNKTDNLLDPSKGFFINAGIEGDKVKKCSTFAKLHFDFRKYFCVNENSVLAIKLKTATLATRNAIDEIPYPYRFFTGGQMRLRGYRFSSLSPLSENLSLEGGKGLIESSVEYRFPLRDEFKGVVFFETGRVTRKSNPFISGEPLKSDLGFGLRYLTPVGPVGMDIAFRLNRAEYSSSRFQIFLFIGYSF